MLSGLTSLPQGILFIGGTDARAQVVRYILPLYCDTQTGCETCTPCQQIRAGSSCDVRIIEDQTIGIDHIRQVLDEAKFGPNGDKPLILYFPEANQISPQAANAYLKFLEESPAGVTSIFQSQRLQDVLPTIQSRCFHLYLPAKRSYIDDLVATIETDMTPVRLVDLIAADTVERFAISEQLAKSKAATMAHLQLWAYEALDEAHGPFLRTITAALSSMGFHVNSRLQLDRVVLSLP